MSSLGEKCLVHSTVESSFGILLYSEYLEAPTISIITQIIKIIIVRNLHHLKVPLLLPTAIYMPFLPASFKSIDGTLFFIF